MLDARIYRAALPPVVLAIVVAAFSLANRPRPVGTTLAPDAFVGLDARKQLDALAARFPDRRPGSPGDDALASAVAQQFRNLSPTFEVRTVRFDGETIDGDRPLRTVLATQAGAPAPQLVVVAHRDAAGRGAEAELSGTAAMLEIARAVADGRLRRTITFASVSGGSGGAAGAADLAHRLGTPVDAVLVLDDLAGARARRPFVIGWSDGGGSAPLRLQRTVEAAVQSEIGADPGAAPARAQLARLAFPVTVTEQGELGRAGLPAVALSVSGERGPSPREPVSTPRLQAFGRAALRAIYALDNGPDIEGGPQSSVVTARKVLPGWAFRLLALALLLPSLLVTIDGFARARRRRANVGQGMRRVLAAAAPFAVACGFAWLLGATGLIAATPRAPAPVGAIPVDGRALVSIGLVLLFVLTLVRRPLAVHAPADPGDGAGMLLCLLAVCVIVWVMNPFAALLLVPAAHLWLALAAGEVRMRRPLAVLLVLVGLAPFALVALSDAHALGMGLWQWLWALVLAVAGGHLSAGTWLLWSLCAGCALVALLLALARRREPEPPPAPHTRPTLGYAGPGSLGGTESALRR
jgi:Peptidase family M28